MFQTRGSPRLVWGNRYVKGRVVDHSVGVLSGTLELLCWWEENVTVSGFKLAAIKRNTDNNCGNKKHQNGNIY